jgi:hypothetical protein
MDKTINNSRNFLCKYAGHNVVLEWQDVIVYDGRQPLAPKLGALCCTGSGTGDCPVKDKQGNSDWSLCPHLPKY